MAKMKINAYFCPRMLSFEEGITEFFRILKDLQRVAPFDLGWEAEGCSLASDPEGLRSVQRSVQAGSEGFDGGYYFALAESARSIDGQRVPIEQYIAGLRFEQAEGRLTFDVSVLEEVVTVELACAVIKVLQGWWPLQHVLVEMPFYSPYDSPLDERRQVGLEWGGWVPFALTPEQLREAGVVKPLGTGTFIAVQDTYWDVTNRDAVKCAQALETRLAGMGLLPSRAALFKGDWGTKG